MLLDTPADRRLLLLPPLLLRFLIHVFGRCIGHAPLLPRDLVCEPLLPLGGRFCPERHVVLRVHGGGGAPGELAAFQFGRI